MEKLTQSNDERPKYFSLCLTLNKAIRRSVITNQIISYLFPYPLSNLKKIVVCPTLEVAFLIFNDFLFH